MPGVHASAIFGRLLSPCLLVAVLLAASGLGQGLLERLEKRSRRKHVHLHEPPPWREPPFEGPQDVHACPPKKRSPRSQWFQSFPEYKRGMWIRHNLSFEAAASLPAGRFRQSFCCGRIECDGQDCNCSLQHVEQPVEWMWRLFKQQDLKAAWDVEHFCQLLGHRVLYFVGDSTMRQSFFVVVNTILQTGGACYKQLVFQRSYMLSEATILIGKDYIPPLNEILNELVSNKSASAVIVIGGGAHHNQLEVYNATLRWVVGYLGKHKPLFAHDGRLRMLWKTVNAPHRGCEVIREPAIYAPGFWVSRHLHPVYGFWNNYDLYDQFAVEWLGMSGLVSTIVDMTPTYLRGDAHSPDCLHACVNDMTGSPLEILAYKLYDALRCPEKVLV